MSRATKLLAALGPTLLVGLMAIWVWWGAGGLDRWDGPVVPAALETEPARGTGDVADDPVIWVHPEDPALSLVIGTNKGGNGGLQVFDLNGVERQFLPIGRLNNVDLRHGFTFADGPGTLIAASNRSSHAVEFFRLDEASLRVEPIGSVSVDVGEPYGLCLNRSAVDRRTDVLVTSLDGEVGQYVLSVVEGAVTLTVVRRFALQGTAEGCVADDEYGRFYLTEEARGLWMFEADPSGTAVPSLIDEVRQPEAALVPDVEGVALYDAGAGEGYLLVSSQGNSAVAVYDRRGSNPYVGSVRIGHGPAVDSVSSTDGLDVTSAALDPRFPDGLLVVHDHENEGAKASNFKYVSWRDVEEALGLGS